MLATNMFFWDWTNAPTPPATGGTTGRANAGSGHAARGGKDTYHPLPDEFWDERALHLAPRDLTSTPAPKSPPPVPPAVAAPSQPNLQAVERLRVLGALQQSRQMLVATAAQSRDVSELKARALKLSQLDAAIAQLKKLVAPA